MTQMITREQFASAVAAAVSSVHHLYREVYHLMVALRERLKDEPNSLIAMPGTVVKAGRDQGRLLIRNEYGALFAATGSDDDINELDDEEVEEEGDDTEDDGTKVRSKRRPIELLASRSLLAVRLLIYDPGKKDSLEPQIQYAVMNGWAVGNGSSNPQQTFLVGRSMLRRIPKALGSPISIVPGSRLMTAASVKGVRKTKKGSERRLGCALPCGVQTVPLYSLSSAEALNELVQGMKFMWNQAGPKEQAANASTAAL